MTEVEELLEKGARALVGEDSIFEWEDVSPYAKARMRERAADVLDAVFPGWREGTRETDIQHVRGGDCSRCYSVTRWVGPWVPAGSDSVDVQDHVTGV